MTLVLVIYLGKEFPVFFFMIFKSVSLVFFFREKKVRSTRFIGMKQNHASSIVDLMPGDDKTKHRSEKNPRKEKQKIIKLNAKLKNLRNIKGHFFS